MTGILEDRQCPNFAHNYDSYVFYSFSLSFDFSILGQLGR
jgi:hypothetical protein